MNRTLFANNIIACAALLMTAICRPGQAQTITLNYQADAASGSATASKGIGSASIPSDSGAVTLANNVTVKNVNFGAIAGGGGSTVVGSFQVNFAISRKLHLKINGGPIFIEHEILPCSVSGRLFYFGGDTDSWWWTFTLATFEKTYDLGLYGKLRATFHGCTNGSSGGGGSPATYWGNSGPFVDLTYLAP